jgi:hypothetical protein
MGYELRQDGRLRMQKDGKESCWARQRLSSPSGVRCCWLVGLLVLSDLALYVEKEKAKTSRGTSSLE